ncbi:MULTISPECIES: helix-turn-helix domain-containing protein [Paenibacillus]|uniref:Transposase n=1 Tax=Paenibacillus pabuli TaxID=1472 RepID=A0A855XRQ0_9BACL|nr:MULTISPECIES: hypothetical protein [Paenibacillus]PWW37879.1 transposase [Paenibacillus pabuli]PXW08106.1 transposase [Paenibacillus taichungensis]
MNISNRIENELSKTSLPAYKQNCLQAIKYHLEGAHPNEISDKIGVSIRSVQRYIKDYTESSLKEQLYKRSPGNHNPISAKKIKALLNDLEKSPQDFGFVISKWSPKILVTHIERKFDIAISLEWCRKFLKKHSRNNSKEHEECSSEIKFKQFEQECKQLLKSGSSVWFFGQFYVGLRPLRKIAVQIARKSRVTAIFAMQMKLEEHGELTTMSSSNMIYLYSNRDHKIKEKWKEIFIRALKYEKNKKIFFFSPKSQYAKWAASFCLNEGKKKVKLNFFPKSYSSEGYLKDAKEDVFYELKKHKKTKVYLEENKRRYDKRFLTVTEYKAFKKILTKRSAN